VNIVEKVPKSKKQSSLLLGTSLLAKLTDCFYSKPFVTSNAAAIKISKCSTQTKKKAHVTEQTIL